MKFKVTISMDNAAFDEVPGAEVSRILIKLAGEILQSPKLGELEAGPYRLKDINGNKVGRAYVEREEGDPRT